MSEHLSLLKDSQMDLAPSVQAVHASRAERIRELYRKAIAVNRMSLSYLARISDCDNSQITRMLDGRANLDPAFTSAVMEADLEGVLILGLADMCGRDAPVRQPDPAAEARKYRDALMGMRAELDRLLAKVPGGAP